MIEDGYDAFFDNACDIVEINDHSTRRTSALQRSLDGNFQAVRVAVWTGALSLMVRKRVRRFEAEVFAYLRSKEPLPVPSIQDAV